MGGAATTRAAAHRRAAVAEGRRAAACRRVKFPYQRFPATSRVSAWSREQESEVAPLTRHKEVIGIPQANLGLEVGDMEDAVVLFRLVHTGRMRPGRLQCQ